MGKEGAKVVILVAAIAKVLMLELKVRVLVKLKLRFGELVVRVGMMVKMMEWKLMMLMRNQPL